MVDLPPREIADEYIDILHTFVYTFIDTSESVANRSGDQAVSNPPLSRLIRKASCLQDIEAQLINCDNLALSWLTQCMASLPITIYTDEEKRSLLKDIAYVSEKISSRQLELMNQETNPMPGRRRIPIFLHKKLQSELKFLQDELHLIYKRAKNYVRRS